ncbi:MAG: hypothetical protein Q7S12_00070 [bacterium]|nr:hypothetical protein [bacterium]
MDLRKKLNNKIIYYVAIFAVGVFFFGYNSVSAATLQINSNSITMSQGGIMTLSVVLNSEGVAINNAEAKIVFPKDLLEVVSVSKSGSVFSLWIEEPTYSNITGTITFNGGIPTPGFNGQSGTVLFIVVKAKTAGQADLIFSDATVRANDGLGTNVLNSKNGKTITITSKVEYAPTETPAVAPSILALQIISPTHPDPNKWYAVSSAKFNWNVPKDITAVRLLVGKIPNAIPTITYTTPINSKEIADLADGIWYFSVRLKNSAGWGAVSRFRFQIDTAKPSSFNITEIIRKDLIEPKASFIFDAKDDVSGIDHYEIQIDGGNAQIWNDDGTKTYTTTVLESGKHVLIAKAVDKAGNSLASSAEFVIESLNSPTITEYPKDLQSGEPLIVRGSTFSNSKVTIWLQKEKDDPKSFIVQSDQDGKFTFTADEKLGDGIYRLWAEVIDARGAKSLPSEKITIAIAKPAILRVGSWAVNLLAIIIPLVALIFVLLFIVWYGWHKFSLLRKRIRKEVREVESTLHRAFDTLKEDIREQIKLLEKTRGRRQLTEEEDKIVKQLKEDLDTAENFVKKEIEDIKKEVK